MDIHVYTITHPNVKAVQKLQCYICDEECDTIPNAVYVQNMFLCYVVKY